MDIVNESINFISNAHILIVDVISFIVYLSAGLINYFKSKKLIFINKKSTPYYKL